VILLFIWWRLLIAAVGGAGLDVSPRPVLTSLCIAGSATFLTPIAITTSMMVMGPGGFSFTRDRKPGTPPMLWFFVIAVFYGPLVWHF